SERRVLSVRHRLDLHLTLQHCIGVVQDRVDRVGSPRARRRSSRAPAPESVYTPNIARSDPSGRAHERAVASSRRSRSSWLFVDSAIHGAGALAIAFCISSSPDWSPSAIRDSAWVAASQYFSSRRVVVSPPADLFACSISRPRAVMSTTSRRTRSARTLSAILSLPDDLDALRLSKYARFVPL